MSSTKRGGQRSEADNYQTPPWCVERLMEKLGPRFNPEDNRWLEPGAGEGNIIWAVNEHMAGINWTAVELRPECRALLRDQDVPAGRIFITDFLTWNPGQKTPNQKFDVAIGNPPFRLAMPFIEKCLKISRLTIMLERLNFFAGPRRDFMRKTTPDVYILPDRPSFITDAQFKRGKMMGQTDSIEYGWFVWPGQGRWFMLDDTPVEARRGGR